MTDLTKLRLRGALRLLVIVLLIALASVVTHMLVCQCFRDLLRHHVLLSVSLPAEQLRL